MSVESSLEPPPAKLVRKKRMIDTLVARDQTAVFWFLVACAVGGGCAWYLVIMAEALKARPPFVVMDSASAYYVAPGLNFDTMTPMHVSLTQLAVETMFDRGPEGLENKERVSRLFSKNGSNDLGNIVKKEAEYFMRQEVQQRVQLEGDPAVVRALPTAALTKAEGFVTRRSIFKGQAQTETYRFKVSFIWKMNPDMRGNRAYPAVVEKITAYNLEKISDL